MRKLIYISCFCFFIAGCDNKKRTPEQIAEAYCECTELSKNKKLDCIKEWAKKYNNALNSIDEYKQLNYSMIECNGFEGDNDFYLKLMRN